MMKRRWIKRKNAINIFFGMEIIALIVAHVALAYKTLNIHYNNYKTNGK